MLTAWSTDCSASKVINPKPSQRPRVNQGSRGLWQHKMKNSIGRQQSEDPSRWASWGSGGFGWGCRFAVHPQGTRPGLVGRGRPLLHHRRFKVYRNGRYSGQLTIYSPGRCVPLTDCKLPICPIRVCLTSCRFIQTPPWSVPWYIAVQHTLSATIVNAEQKIWGNRRFTLPKSFSKLFQI